VALGRCDRTSPKFLMDEPLNLDAKLELKPAPKSSNSQLGATTMRHHDQTEAMTMGSRIAVMNHGQIQQVAHPLELYNRPATRFVAEFIHRREFPSVQLPPS